MAITYRDHLTGATWVLERMRHHPRRYLNALAARVLDEHAAIKRIPGFTPTTILGRPAVLVHRRDTGSPESVVILLRMGSHLENLALRLQLLEAEQRAFLVQRELEP